ncbi:MAG: hypothetical protein WCS17_13380 [Prevotella sp.]
MSLPVLWKHAFQYYGNVLFSTMVRAFQYYGNMLSSTMKMCFPVLWKHDW